MSDVNTNLELEVKILEIDKNALLRRLDELRAHKVLDAMTEIVLFDIHSDIDFSVIPEKYHEILREAQDLTKEKTLREQNYRLRIRKQGDHYELTLKYKVGTALAIRSQIERNLEINHDDWNEIEGLFVRAGLSVIARHQKKRESYDVPSLDVHVDIDTWPGMPTYAEVEGASESIIIKGIQMLGLDESKMTNLSGEQLFDTYGIKFYSNLVFND